MARQNGILKVTGKPSDYMGQAGRARQKHTGMFPRYLILDWIIFLTLPRDCIG